MKLNIYKGREVVKTYTADTYDLMFGTVEDIAEAIKLDDMKIGDDRGVFWEDWANRLLEDTKPVPEEEKIRNAKKDGANGSR